VIAKASPTTPTTARPAAASAVAPSQDSKAPAKPPSFDSSGAEDPILAIAAVANEARSGSEYAVQQPTRIATVPTNSQGLAPRDSRGIYLQLGAFGSRENAESYLSRAKLQLDWLAARLHVLGRDGLFRVHAGPYASSAEARQIADRVALSLGVKPVVVTR
jgi:rare lipoprotein A